MRQRANQDIRQAAKNHGIHLWEVTDMQGVSDMTLSRRLRHELPQPEKDKIFAIIDKLAAEREAAEQGA